MEMAPRRSLHRLTRTGQREKKERYSRPDRAKRGLRDKKPVSTRIPKSLCSKHPFFPDFEDVVEPQGKWGFLRNELHRNRDREKRPHHQSPLEERRGSSSTRSHRCRVHLTHSRGEVLLSGKAGVIFLEIVKFIEFLKC